MIGTKKFISGIKESPIFNFLLEAIGYEHGFFKTINDLYRNPIIVIESNKREEKKYLNPYRLLISVLTAWIIINSFIIDWHKKWLSFAQGIIKFNGLQDSLFRRNFEINVSNFGAALFARYFVPLVIITVIVSSIIADKFCKKYNITFREHLAVMSYSTAINSLGLIGLSVVIAINFYIGLGLIILARILTIFGTRNYLNWVKMRNYFSRNGVEIERKYMFAKFLTYISLVIILSLVIYSTRYR